SLCLAYRASCRAEEGDQARRPGERLFRGDTACRFRGTGSSEILRQAARHPCRRSGSDAIADSAGTGVFHGMLLLDRRAYRIKARCDQGMSALARRQNARNSIIVIINTFEASAAFHAFQ